MKGSEAKWANPELNVGNCLKSSKRFQLYSINNYYYYYSKSKSQCGLLPEGAADKSEYNNGKSKYADMWQA